MIWEILAMISGFATVLWIIIFVVHWFNMPSCYYGDWKSWRVVFILLIVLMY